MSDSRNLRYYVIVVIAVTIAGALAAAVRIASWRPLGTSGPDLQDPYTRVSGVVHVHTTYSDGGGTVDEVIAAAQAAGLDFLIITDHNSFDAKPREAYYDGTLVLVGVEIATETGHILGFGFPEPKLRFSDDAIDTLDDIRELGGVAFAAHPDSLRPDFRWTNWDLPGPWGIELLNGDSQWRAAGWRRLTRAMWNYPLNSTYALLRMLRPPTEMFRLWDQLLTTRAVPAIAGADAHSYVGLTDRLGLRFPSYASMFRLAKNHVLLDRPLTGDARADATAVIDALSQGRAYIGVDALAPAGGFFFVAEGEERTWTMGQEVPLTPMPILLAGGQLPSDATLSLIQDGRIIADARESLRWHASQPGVYRVEVRVPDWEMPWLISNPIYVFDKATQDTRRQRADWPRPPQLPAASEVLDDLDSIALFEPVCDPFSELTQPAFDRNGGEQGDAAVRLAFRLGMPTVQTPSPFCALASFANRDLSSASGLLFSIKGDDIYRVWIQARDVNPASDDGTEWWFASVRTSKEWSRLSVPFTRFRSRDRHTDGQLHLDEIAGLLFIVDTGAVKAGTQGVIWIDDLAMY